MSAKKTLSAYQKAQAVLEDLRSKLAEIRRHTSKYHLPLPEAAVELEGHIRGWEARAEKLKRTPYDTFLLARHPRRPQGLDVARRLVVPLMEFAGDRIIGDDQAIVIGIGEFRGHKVAVIAQQTGHTWQEHKQRNQGTAGPIGYRKAQRLIRMADKFGLPILSFVDTKGARSFCQAGEEGISATVAECIALSFEARVPFIATIVGEGGSGGALAVATADVVLIQQNACYSVISPEGCAKILYDDVSRAPEMADILHLTASEALELKVVDEVIEEPIGGAHAHPDEAMPLIGDAIERYLLALKQEPVDQLLRKRRERFHQY